MGYTIDFNASQVNSTISSMDGVYGQISEVINDLNTKKDTIDGFWSCSESNNFKTVLASVSEDFGKFQKKYDTFKETLNQVINTYKKEEDAYLSKLDSMAKVDGNPSFGNTGDSGSSGDSGSN